MSKSRQSGKRKTSGSTKVKAKAKRYFAGVANRWDEMREDFFDEDLAKKILEASSVKAGNTVVDVGCGTGFLTRQVAVQMQGKGKIIGVDLSPSMLEKAKDNLSKLGLLDTVDFRSGDAENIPLEDGSADAVVGNMILHHCPRPKRAISEMARVLKNGGKIAIADLERHAESWLRKEMADRWLGFELGKVQKWFEDAGLEDVKVELARTRCCGMSFRGRKVEIGIFVASASKPKQLVNP